MAMRKAPVIMFGVMFFASTPVAFAQQIPSTVDTGRIKSIVSPIEKFSPHAQAEIPSVIAPIAMPAGAAQYAFVLKRVKIAGATIFSPEQLGTAYAGLEGTQVTLERMYHVAEAITLMYRDAGYFLSVAYVPPQKIQDGIFTLRVVEGYIGTIEMPEEVRGSRIVQQTVAEILAQKPLRSEQLESALLRLNDLPGFIFNGVLSPMENASEGAVKLAIVTEGRKDNLQISTDNYGSRFLGPQQMSLGYSINFLPQQKTTVSLLSSVPLKRLRTFSVGHVVTLSPYLTLDMEGGMTTAEPKFSLKNFDVESDSVLMSAGVQYQWIRQRLKNLSTALKLESRNSTTDTLSTVLTHDEIRVMRASAEYDGADNWKGYNSASFTLSQGLAGLGASEAGDRNLSRSLAVPDFTKAEFFLSRVQNIAAQWSVVAAASGQIASAPLYSSEEFGYGGQGFGRAYDASEITGDSGVSASLELRYNGWSEQRALQIQPYAFYDVGMVWNRDVGQAEHATGSSAGGGVRLSMSEALINLGVAFPLTRGIATPLYGDDTSSPRFLIQMSRAF